MDALMARTSSLRIVVAGLIAQYPLGGIAWHYLQYVVGLDRLGHDVYYLEDTGKAPYAPAGRDPGEHGLFNVDYLARMMARFGLWERWACRLTPERRWFGMADAHR